MFRVIFFLLLTVMLLEKCSYSQNDKVFSYGSHNVLSKAVLLDSNVLVAFNGQKLFTCLDFNFTKRWSFELTSGCSDFRFDPEDNTLTLLQVMSKTNRQYLLYTPLTDKLPKARHKINFPEGLLSVTFLAKNRILAFGETYLLIQDVFTNNNIFNVTGKDWLQLAPFVESAGKIVGYISSNECDIACRVLIDTSLIISDMSKDFRNMKWRTGSELVIKDTVFAISSNKNEEKYYSFFDNRDLKVKIGESKITREMILEDFSLSRNIMILNDPVKHRVVLTQVN